MADQGKVIARQVEGGKWQASFENGPPNVFSTGDTEQEARDGLFHRHIDNHAITTRKLARPTVIQGKTAIYVAYRDGTPDIQAYGETAEEAKKSLLTREKDDEVHAVEHKVDATVVPAPAQIAKKGEVNPPAPPPGGTPTGGTPTGEK